MVFILSWTQSAEIFFVDQNCYILFQLLNWIYFSRSGWLSISIGGGLEPDRQPVIAETIADKDP